MTYVMNIGKKPSTEIIDGSYTNTAAAVTFNRESGGPAGGVTIFSNIKPVIEKNEKDFGYTLANDVTFNIVYTDENNKEKIYSINAKKGYKWSYGNSFIRKCAEKFISSPVFAVAKMIYNLLKENHIVFEDNRKVTKNIFRALAKKNGATHEATEQVVKTINPVDTVDKEYTKTLGAAPVTNLLGRTLGNVTVFGNERPIIEKTGDKEWPFILANDVTFNIVYKDNNNNEKVYRIDAKKGYKWDGASIPSFCQRFVGKNDESSFAVASMVHDLMCEDKSLVDHDRILSSNIFKALLSPNKTPSRKAKVMAWFVDCYQKFFANWKRK